MYVQLRLKNRDSTPEINFPCLCNLSIDLQQNGKMEFTSLSFEKLFYFSLRCRFVDIVRLYICILRYISGHIYRQIQNVK